MRRFPHLKKEKKTGNLVYYRRVPEFAQKAFGKKIHERSLGSPDLRAIARRWDEEHNFFENKLQEIRNGELIPGSSSIPIVVPTVTIPVAFLSRLVRDWKERELYRRAQAVVNDPFGDWKEFREEWWLLIGPDKRKDADGQNQGADAVGSKEHYDPATMRAFFRWVDGRRNAIRDVVRRLIDQANLPLTARHDTHNVLAQMVADTWMDILEQERRWRNMDYSSLPTEPPSENAPVFQPSEVGPTLSNVGLRLGEIADHYIADVRPDKDTASDLRTIIRRLVECMGKDKPAAEISRSDLTKFKLEAARLPARMTQAQRKMTFRQLVDRKNAPVETTIKPQTLRKWFNLLSACFSWGVAHGYVPTNPTTGIKPKVPKFSEKPRLSFTDDELATLFKSRVYTDRDGVKPSQFWLPLLAAYTGARLNELGQLARADIKIAGGVPYIDITDFSDDPDVVKTLKTQSSRRRVPLHPALVEIGFLKYVEGVHSKFVFPELNHRSPYGPTHAYSKWFGRYLDSIDLTARKLTFHSLRHSFIGKLRNKLVQEAVISSLVGHATELHPTVAMGLINSTTTSEYGDDHAIHLLASEISKLKYERLPSFATW